MGRAHRTSCVAYQSVSRLRRRLARLTGGDIAYINIVNVCIVRQPTGKVDGVSLTRFRVGRCYDLAPSLADYLIVRGFAVLEMRRTDRARPLRPTDRRRMKSNP